MNNTYKYICILALSPLLWGCSSLLPGIGKKPTPTKGSEAQTVAPAPADPQPAQPVPATPTAPAQPAVSADTVAKAPAASLATLVTPLGRELEGRWTIIQVGPTVIDRDEDMPYIIFEPATARFYANNGCNTLNGAYSLDNADKVTFHSVAATLRLCPDAPFDGAINEIISDGHATPLRHEDIGQESFIDFLGHDGTTIMRLRRGNMSFLNGQWDIESVANCDDSPAADIFIDLNEHKIHGNTGCNIVNGDIYLDHRRSNAIDFSNLHTTRMACPPPFDRFQTAMLVALEETATAISDGAQRVMLLGHDGQILMTLRKSPVEKQQ